MSMPQRLPEPLYLDCAASTPPADEVIEAMLPWLRSAHANPHSSHLHGRRAAAAVEEAQAQIAELIGADIDEIVFTSGATEANNLALQGWLSGHPAHLASSKIDHKSVLEVANALKPRGVDVMNLGVDQLGHLVLSQRDLELLARLDGRCLLSLAHANNEIGTLQHLDRLSGRLGSGWRLHVDAAQSAGKVPISVESGSIAFLSLSSHKMYGPGGIGALYVNRDIRREVSPLLYGGGQQGGLRPGTIPVFLAVGFGVAAHLAEARMAHDSLGLKAVTDIFIQRLLGSDIPVKIVGDPLHRLPGHLSLRFQGVDAEDLLSMIGRRVSISTGSACTSGELVASHVLRGIGLEEEEASEVLRVSFGRTATHEHAIAAADTMIAGVDRLRRR